MSELIVTVRNGSKGMAGNHGQGPLGSTTNNPMVGAGTLARSPSHAPGPIGVSNRWTKAQFWARKAAKCIDEDGGFKVLLGILVNAYKAVGLPAFAAEMRGMRHAVYGNYLEAMLRYFQLDADSRMRDVAIKIFAKGGVQIQVQLDRAIIGMRRSDKLMAAARFGAPQLPGEVIDEFVTAVPWIVGFFALSQFFGLGEVLDILGLAFLGKAGYDALRNLSDYYDLAINAQNEADLRMAGGCLSKALAILGVAGLLTLIGSKVRKNRRAKLQLEEAQIRPGTVQPVNGTLRELGLSAQELQELQRIRADFALPEKRTSSSSTMVGVLVAESGERLRLHSDKYGGPYGGTH